MDAKIERLRDVAEPFAREREEREHARRTGGSSRPALRRLHASLAAVSHPSVVEALRDALASGDAEAGTPAQLRALLAFAVAALEEAHRADAEDEIAKLEAQARPLREEPGLTLGSALELLSREPSRERRLRLSRGTDRFLLDHTAVYAGRAETGPRAAETLGFGSWLQVRKELLGHDDQKLEKDAAAFLSRTEDAYRDLLEYAIHRVDPTLRPLPGGSAQRHDLERALAAPWLAPQVSMHGVVRAALKTLAELDLPRGGPVRVRVERDAEDRGEPFAAPILVPEDVRVFVPNSPALSREEAALGAIGEAVRFASADAAAPVEVRRFGDAALAHAAGALFASLLLDEAWVRRQLRLPGAVAREVARMAAFIDVARAREECAALSYERLLAACGPSPDVASAYEDLRRRALLVVVLPGSFLRDVSPALAVADRLRGRALEARLFEYLLQHFNEDWWRNPPPAPSSATPSPAARPMTRWRCSRALSAAKGSCSPPPRAGSGRWEPELGHQVQPADGEVRGDRHVVPQLVPHAAAELGAERRAVEHHAGGGPGLGVQPHRVEDRARGDRGVGGHRPGARGLLALARHQHARERTGRRQHRDRRRRRGARRERRPHGHRAGVGDHPAGVERQVEAHRVAGERDRGDRGRARATFALDCP